MIHFLNFLISRPTFIKKYIVLDRETAKKSETAKKRDLKYEGKLNKLFYKQYQSNNE
jgi:hypothetical protein